MHRIIVALVGWVTSALCTMWSSHIVFGHFGHPGFDFPTSLLLTFIAMLSVIVGIFLVALVD